MNKDDIWECFDAFGVEPSLFALCLYIEKIPRLSEEDRYSILLSDLRAALLRYRNQKFKLDFELITNG